MMKLIKLIKLHSYFISALISQVSCYKWEHNLQQSQSTETAPYTCANRQGFNIVIC